MNAYEFNTTAEDGFIRIPDEYKEKIRSTIKVIVLSQEDETKTKEKDFSAIGIKTKGFRFNRDDSNER